MLRCLLLCSGMHVTLWPGCFEYVHDPAIGYSNLGKDLA